MERLLIPIPEKGYSVPDKQGLRDEILTTVSAGDDTTGIANMVTLFNIINNPKIHARLQKELKTLLPTPTSHASYLDLERLPYLVRPIPLSPNIFTCTGLTPSLPTPSSPQLKRRRINTAVEPYQNVPNSPNLTVRRHQRRSPLLLPRRFANPSPRPSRRRNPSRRPLHPRRLSRRHVHLPPPPQPGHLREPSRL